MSTSRSRARSHAHTRLHGRAVVHLLVVALAAVSVLAATRFPERSSAISPHSPATFALPGITGMMPAREIAVLRPGTSQVTHESVTVLTTRSDVSSVRAAAAVSPLSSFSSGVAVAAVEAAAAGDEDFGVTALAEVVDPTKPFILHTVESGDSISLLAQRHGVESGTILDNNPTVDDESHEVILPGQEILIPRADGILHKVGHGETVAEIVGQYDNITEETVLNYRPNALKLDSTLEAGRYLLLPNATRKPPPPPPPPPPPVPSNPGASPGGSGSAPPPSGGRFSLPLATWHGVSDPFGVYRGVGRIHEGIDLDLWGLWNSPIYSSCNGVVSRVEYLTYSYGYHVIVDCGDGWTTLYAHMSQIHVVPGQGVSQGTQLGISGVTGYTTGEHLHFEIRLNGAPVNPANYLPF